MESSTVQESPLREEYARYFFSMFEAGLNDDAVGQREAQLHLEAALGRVVPAVAS